MRPSPRALLALLLLVFALVLVPAPLRVSAEPMRLALGLYVPWFDQNTWNAGITSDLPVPLFNADDRATIQRDLALAQQAGLNGFVSFWIAPGNRTDRNFAQLLRQSQGTDFRSAVLFLTHIMGAPDANALVEALGYVRRTYGAHSNYLRYKGRPVVFFSDMPRVPAGDGLAPGEFWRTVRDRVDPDRSMFWIAEGLDPSYLTVFDGLYVLKVTHAAYPEDYLKAPRWARQARAYGPDKLWIATITPGWDDSRTRAQPGGDWAPAPPHVMDRAGGDFYRRTFQAAMDSQPDWLLVHSWNEFIEGSHVHPSRNFGDAYIALTAELVAAFKTTSAAPPPPSSAPAASGPTLPFDLARQYPELAPDGAVRIVAAWSNGSYAYLVTSYPELRSNGAVAKAYQWDNGLYTCVLDEYPELRADGRVYGVQRWCDGSWKSWSV